MKLPLALVALVLISGCSTVSLDSVRKVTPVQQQPYVEAQMRSTVELSKIVIGLERGAVYGQLVGWAGVIKPNIRSSSIENLHYPRSSPAKNASKRPLKIEFYHCLL
jgi:hypothetical protein